MSDERSWGADTVALGRSAGGKPQAAAEPKRRAGGGPRLPGRGGLAAMVGVAAVAVLVAVVSGGGDGSQHRATRPAAPAPPRVMVTRPERHPLPKSHRRRRRVLAKGSLEGGRERRAASAPTPERAAPSTDAAPEAMTEVAPEPEPLPEPAAAPPPAPTPPGVEFGM